VIHERLRVELERRAARLDAVYHCPHEAGTCLCRKPEPGLLQRAARDFGARPQEAVMIGDAPSDVEAGRRFGALTVQLTDGPSGADLSAPDLEAAVDALLAPAPDRRPLAARAVVR
jgi:D-glycero-D-manno-heptose 1,7-bisphosphate phosphatase